MIQRKQTLFVLAMVLCNCLLLFIPVAQVTLNNLNTSVFLVPFAGTEPVSTMGHFTAIALNFLELLISFAVIFLYTKRKLQVQLIWVLILLWITLGLMIGFCPLVVKTESIQAITTNYLTAFIAIPALLAGWMAIRNIKKDIDLLKSADRIR